MVSSKVSTLSTETTMKVNSNSNTLVPTKVNNRTTCENNKESSISIFNMKNQQYNSKQMNNWRKQQNLSSYKYQNPPKSSGEKRYHEEERRDTASDYDDDDMKEWVTCDSNHQGFQIMSDDEIVEKMLQINEVQEMQDDETEENIVVENDTRQSHDVAFHALEPLSSGLKNKQE
ncbi:hypothetical protein HHI36_017067 [Cryptolaemus montrouzieri]|uniref:Uncharacterized protein n=1 Tax=Cryptolaemus montrouzieri TaxID=559131 RepID=A0ABD2NML4_9CUCU